MKVKMHYGNGVLCLPEAVLDRLGEVDAVTLKVLLRLSAGDNASREKIAADVGCSVDAIAVALDFWRLCGVLEPDKKAPVAEAPKPSAKPTASPAPRVSTVDSVATPPQRSTTVPRYSTEELSALLESRGELTSLLDECARVFGKVFSTHEIGILLGIIDYLGVEGEYLLLLLAHCAKLGKKSVRYVETVAISLYDEGITEPGALQECLRQKEQLAEVEGKLRTLFGLSSRALTTKEKKLIHTWLFTYHYDLDVISRAYEMTVDAIGKPSLPYAGSILDRWAAADLHTLPEIEAADAARAAGGKTPSAPGNSFDTDDFFGAALQRSFGDDFKPSNK